MKGKEEPIAVFEPLGAGGALRTKAANNFLDRGDHADHLQARGRGRNQHAVVLSSGAPCRLFFTETRACLSCTARCTRTIPSGS